jgi:hypothetical protein
MADEEQYFCEHTSNQLEWFSKNTTKKKKSLILRVPKVYFRKMKVPIITIISIDMKLLHALKVLWWLA